MEKIEKWEPRFFCPREGCRFSTTDRHNPHCGDCGEKLIGKCPACGTPLSKKVSRNCIHCGASIKVLPRKTRSGSASPGAEVSSLSARKTRRKTPK